MVEAGQGKDEFVEEQLSVPSKVMPKLASCEIVALIWSVLPAVCPVPVRVPAKVPLSGDTAAPEKVPAPEGGLHESEQFPAHV